MHNSLVTYMLKFVRYERVESMAISIIQSNLFSSLFTWHTNWNPSIQFHPWTTYSSVITPTPIFFAYIDRQLIIDNYPTSNLL